MQTHESEKQLMAKGEAQTSRLLDGIAPAANRVFSIGVRLSAFIERTHGPSAEAGYVEDDSEKTIISYASNLSRLRDSIQYVERLLDALESIG